MTKHTAKAGPVPNGAIDFNKVHEAAKDGSGDIYKGAVSNQSRRAPEADEKILAAVAAEEAERLAEAGLAPAEPAPSARKR